MTRSFRLGLCVLLALPVLVPVPPALGQDVPTRIGFTWEMAPRFGLDRDGDGRIEIENSHSYVNNRVTPCADACPPQRFRVTLRATPDPADYGLSADLVSYEWRISGPAGSATHHRRTPELNVRLPEGIHDVDLRAEVRVLWGTITLRRRGTIEVDDVLVVSLGDSYASGEGNPEIPLAGDAPAFWADASDATIAEEHAVAHRSSVGWPAQVASALEIGDPHTSVTFVHLAASSARIGDGVIRPHPFLALPAQLDQLEAIVGERTIDVILLQVGGNDIGFSQLVRELVEADPLLDPICYDTMIDNARASVVDGRWDRGVSLRYDPPFDLGCRSTGGIRTSRPGLSGLPREIDLLAAQLGTLEVGRIVVAEYPDPTGSEEDGALCDEIVGDTTPPFRFHEVDEQEQAWGRAEVVAPLNEIIRAGAERHGWDVLTGLADAFLEGHGYCAPWPDYGYPDAFDDAPFVLRDRLGFPSGWYRPPGTYGSPLLLNRGEVSWYRTAAQSAALQGPAPRFRTSGTLHPNELGHQAIARRALAALAGD